MALRSTVTWFNIVTLLAGICLCGFYIALCSLFDRLRRLTEKNVELGNDELRLKSALTKQNKLLMELLEIIRSISVHPGEFGSQHLSITRIHSAVDFSK